MAVPPPYHGSVFRVLRLYEIAFFLQVASQLAVGGHERTHPEHHLEAHGVQCVYHCLGIREAVRAEFPVAVIFLPVVVDHQYACGEPVVDDGMGVSQNVVLVLVVGKFYPAVVDRLVEKESRRAFPGGGKVLLHFGKVGVTQVLSFPCEAEGASVDLDRKSVLLGLETERSVCPDTSSLVGHEQRGCLVVEVLCP